MNNFYTKYDIAHMIVNQYDCSQKTKTNMAKKLTRLHESYFQKEILKAGFKVENFGFNRYNVV